VICTERLMLAAVAFAHRWGALSSASRDPCTCRSIGALISERTLSERRGMGLVHGCDGLKTVELAMALHGMVPMAEGPMGSSSCR